jgi:uncharacterized protein YcgI (DUF1989 family)
MSVSYLKRLAPQSGCALTMRSGESLEIVSPYEAQVADFACFARLDPREYFSSGRTLDYNERSLLTTGAVLYSSRSRQMMRIVYDNAGRHDYLLTPCSAEMFRILRGEEDHPSCHQNLTKALREYGILEDDVHSTFNAFMNVDFASDGKITIGVPSSKKGSRVVLRAQMDLIVGLTSCSSEYSNNGACKPIDYGVTSFNTRTG